MAGEERKIGVAIDFSPSSKLALRWTIENVIREGDYLLLLSIVSSKGLEGGRSQLWEESGSPLIPLCDLGDAALMKGYGVVPDAEILTVSEKAAREKKIVVVGKVYYGDAREKLCEAATDLQLNSIVMGSRGLGTLKRALLGSVSNYVVNNATCPVTVVR